MLPLNKAQDYNCKIGIKAQDYKCKIGIKAQDYIV